MIDSSTISTSKNKKSNTRLYSHHRHWQTSISRNRDSIQAVQELLSEVMEQHDEQKQSSPEQRIAFLFVDQSHIDSFEEIVHIAYNTLNDNGEDNVQLLSLVGGGVVGGGIEADGGLLSGSNSIPAMTMLHGTLPGNGTANAKGFYVSDDDPASWIDLVLQQDDEDVAVTSDGVNDSNSNDDDDGEIGRKPSYILFADPWARIIEILEGLDESNYDNFIDDDYEDYDPSSRRRKSACSAVVAGGISCPTTSSEQSTVALNGRALPGGSAVGIRFTGSVGLQAIVAQGCRPVGPTFTVSSVSKGGNVIAELNGEPALHLLASVAQEASMEDRALIQKGGLLCGVSASGRTTDDEDDDDDDDDALKRQQQQHPQDFLIRQIIALQPPSYQTSPDDAPSTGGIVIGGGQVRRGDKFRFHVRDAKAARDDMNVMVQRANTERLFAGSQRAGGTPIAALQISCVARGQALFGEPNVDFGQVSKLLDSSSSLEDDHEKPISSSVHPIAGFFANGEIGPVGLAGFASSLSLAADYVPQKTYIHGFTTVVALICEFNNATSSSSLSSTWENDLSGPDEETSFFNDTIEGGAWG